MKLPSITIKALTIVTACALALIPNQPTAAGSDSATTVLDQYLAARGYTTIVTKPAIYVPCPTGYRCLGWTAVIGYDVNADGAGGSIAIVSGGVTCPSCGEVLVSGGGVLDAPGFESYGFDSTTAQSLVSQLNSQ